MSNKEIITQLLENVPDYKIGYILAYVQGLVADEEADDAFCERLYKDYIDDPNQDKDELVSLEDCKKEWGVQ